MRRPRRVTGSPSVRKRGGVHLPKIDVEGLKARLIHHLIDGGVIDRIDYIFCEPRSFKLPWLWRDCRRLRRRLRYLGIRHVNLDWT